MDLNEPGNESRVADILKGLESIAKIHAPTNHRLLGLDTFPGVVWVSVGGEESDTEELNNLSKRVDEIVDLSGLAPSRDFKFLPHITLARFPRDRQDLVVAAIQGIKPNPAPMALHSVDLLESTRDEDGVNYRPAFEGSVYRFKA